MFFGGKKPQPKPQPEGIPVVSTTIGAFVDSFYRSGMNSLINARLTQMSTGQAMKVRYFPNMHIQLPTRILYINGIKNLRVYLEREKVSYLAKNAGANKRLVEASTLIAPGLLMTPFSSLLEASNAGHMNSEPMSLRWTRGLLPRSVREVIFAVGLNQASDVVAASEAMTKYIAQPLASIYVSDSQTHVTATKNVVGSIIAGAAAGYLSHVPHNLSALKLLKPQVSYSVHFGQLVQASAVRFTAAKQLSPSQYALGVVGVFLFPKSVFIRTGQIIGSFVIVNGAIAICKSYAVEERVLKNFKPAVIPSTLK